MRHLRPKGAVESAEEQLDRLLPQLIDAKRRAERYRSEADAAPVLRRQLAALRDQIGVPKAEHDAAIAELEDRWDESLATYEAALRVVLHGAARAIEWIADHRNKPLSDARFITPTFIDAMQMLPEGACDEFLKAVEAPRNWRRDTEHWSGAAEALRDDLEREYLHVAMVGVPGMGLTKPERRTIVKNCETLTGRQILKSKAVVGKNDRKRVAGTVNGEQP